VRTTWQYLGQHIQRRAVALGLKVHVASHKLATVDLYGKNGDLLVPAFTATGKFPTYCSQEWKARVVARYARQVLGVGGPIVNWIGFSWDERGRLKGEQGRCYPLIDLMLTKEDCISIIERAGLPLPKKSRCYMCPHQDNAEWREVRESPAEWQAALREDEEIRENDERGGLYLHQSRMPLREADLGAEDRKEAGRQCGLGMCFV
jgi:hypothetical protein